MTYIFYWIFLITIILFKQCDLGSIYTNKIL